MILFKGLVTHKNSSKYTELLQLKNIFRIFWNYFSNISEANVFENKNQDLCKKHGYFLKNGGHR